MPGVVMAEVLRRRTGGVLVAVGAAALAGVLSGVWTPRGPSSAGEALAAMATGLLVGVVAGAAMRSRWAALVAPAVFVALFELVRADASGPTVDAIDLTNAYGVLAFGTGRLFHGVLVLVPMLVGVALGRAWARRRDAGDVPSASGWARAGRALGRTVLVATVAGLLVLGVALLRPASTDPITDASGEPLPDSVAELTDVEVGGHDQSLLIRGRDVDNPVLLFLAGGPGGSELGAMSRYATPLERDFVVVTWDQLGTGRSTGQFDPADTLSVDRAVSDTLAVTDYLRRRFGADRVYLAGNSYGTILGVRAVQQSPERYAAYVGTGQMVDVTATDRMFYEDALAYAESSGDEALRTTLVGNGPPPYADLLDMAPLVASEHLWNDYTDIEGFPGRREPTDNLFVSEYSLMDQVRSMAGLLDTYVALYPALADVDLRVDAPTLEVPVYLVQGAHEARGRAVLAEEWFAGLDAPRKELVVFARSGHRPWVQEPGRFRDVMVDTVRAQTAPGLRDGSAPVDGGGPDGAAADGGEGRAPNALLGLLTRSNEGTWPAHLLAYALGLTVVTLVLRRPGAATDRVVAGTLAATWLWLGVVFHARYAAEVDPLLGAVYGALFVAQAGLFLRAGFVRRDLSFGRVAGPAARFGLLVLAFALAVYPLLGLALGHGWPETPLFGTAPCPTTIATFGLLLLARPPLPRVLLWIPLAWALLAPLAAVGQGVYQDVALFVVGVAAVGLVLVRDRVRPVDDVEPPGEVLEVTR